MPNSSSEPLAEWLAIATDAALEAGAILRSYIGNLTHIEEKGRPGDLVTEADKASERVILDIFKQALPDHQILAEESGSLGNATSRYLWAIDPLDGTTNFAHGYPMSSVSIGLMIDGIPQLGVIYDPFRQDLFCGATGIGATLNHQPIRVSKTAELRQSLLVTGFAYDRHHRTDNNYAEFCYLTHLTQGVRRGGSAAMDLAYVACGRLDGYWERGLSPWDITAGIAIVEAAGGQVSAYDQSPISIPSGRILATNGQIHGALSQALQQVPPIGVWGDLAQIAQL